MYEQKRSISYQDDILNARVKQDSYRKIDLSENSLFFIISEYLTML